MKHERDRAHLKHILECTALIQTYTQAGKAEFLSNMLVRDAVLRRLQTMAESTQRLSEAARAQAPEIDWRALSGFRNVLVHDYLGGIDLEQVWEAIESYLPGLDAAAQKLMSIDEE